MRACVPQVQCAAAGVLDTKCYVGMQDRARGYDVGYVGVIDGRGGLEAYAKSDRHTAAVKDSIAPVLDEGGILAFDYTVPGGGLIADTDWSVMEGYTPYLLGKHQCAAVHTRTLQCTPVRCKDSPFSLSLSLSR